MRRGEERRGEGNEGKGSCMNEFGERLLSPLKGPRVHSSYTCYHPVSRLAQAGKFFPRANDLVLHSLFVFPRLPFFTPHTPVLHSFFVTVRRKMRRAPRGRLSIAALIAPRVKAHGYARIGGVCGREVRCILFVAEKQEKSREGENGRLE